MVLCGYTGEVYQVHRRMIIIMVLVVAVVLINNNYVNKHYTVINI